MPKLRSCLTLSVLLLATSLLTTSCGGGGSGGSGSGGGAVVEPTHDAWNHRAAESVKLVRSLLDINNEKSVTTAQLDDAVQKMYLAMEHPETIKLQVKQDVSFDATPPVQTSIGPGQMLFTARRIIHAYERLGAWDKAGEIAAKAVQFADQFNQSHPPAKNSRSLDNYVSAAEYVALYREYARCLERCGKPDQSREYSKLALAKLQELEKSTPPASAATGWAATVAESTRQTCVFEYDALGIIGLERGDSNAEVEPLFKRASELSKQSKTPVRQAESMQQWGMALLKKKRNKTAPEYFPPFRPPLDGYSSR